MTPPGGGAAEVPSGGYANSSSGPVAGIAILLVVGAVAVGAWKLRRMRSR
ncbi:MAG: hypothetical protein FWD75_01150 [Propionibacteriaceae bacterium]|nr:hypothetical protein [Propionibacteriaceae bacterium]